MTVAASGTIKKGAEINLNVLQIQSIPALLPPHLNYTYITDLQSYKFQLLSFIIYFSFSDVSGKFHRMPSTQMSQLKHLNQLSTQQYYLTIQMQYSIIILIIYSLISCNINMDQTIYNEIAQFANSQLKIKSRAPYLKFKQGYLPFKVGFNTTICPQKRQPRLDFEASADPISYNLNSSKYANTYSLKEAMNLQEKSLQSRLCDLLIQKSISEASIKTIQNKNGQLDNIEKHLSEMIQSGRVNINTFSQNSLTNIGKYDIDGSCIGVQSVIIPPQSKKYTELQSLNNAPHQIRKSKHRKIKNQILMKKTERQVMQEFQYLANRFSVSQEQQQGQDILQILKFNDNLYNDLWDKIIEDMDLTKKPEPKQKNIYQSLDDKQMTQVVSRIMKEAIQYEKDLLEIQQDEEQQQSEKEQQIKQQMVENVPKPQQQKKEASVHFETIKIEKKAEMIRDHRYQFAVEDETDVSNFYDRLPRDKMAFQYSFELDPFQKRAVLHLEQKQSVFVAAHTSAGKTVVAEYGIALAIKHKRKVIYTSPIKALSNQKYRQLSQKFDSVGIVTGDVSLNQSANCVIMTTQILRNSLYKGAEMIRDIEWVIFDQVHYINNPERGVVWEETIIMLPEHIGIIMLSATVPNYMDFANWVGRTKRRTVFVIKTLHRPVPLQHSLYIFNKFHVIKQANGRFLQQQYNDLKRQINDANLSHDAKKQQLREDKKKKIEQRGFFNDSRRQQKLKLTNKLAVDKFIKKIQKADIENAQGKQQSRLIQTLVHDCNKKNLLPCVVFIFSKKKINQIAHKIYGNVLTDGKQQFKILSIISKALSNLKEEDRSIQQFTFLTAICRNGYAIHHGDLLPLAKEIVQILFSAGLIKVLLATQTFAMGINMPTKTVIYQSIKKVSGSEGQLRFLNSSQYVQMSGRAGRRGLDEKGTVIIVVKDVNNLPDSHEMIKMIDHPGQELHSQFRITYEIILNLYMSKDISVKNMMQQSYKENPKFSGISSNLERAKQLQKRYEQASDIDCMFNKLGTRNIIEQYMTCANQIRNNNQAIFSSYDFRKITMPKYALLLGHNNQTQLGIIYKLDLQAKAKNIGRYIHVVLINEIDTQIYINKQEMQAEENKQKKKKRIILQYDRKDDRNKTGPIPGTDNKYHYLTNTIQATQIIQLYQNKLPVPKQNQFTREGLQQLGRLLINPPKQLGKIPLPEIQESGIRNSLLQQYMGKQCNDCPLKEKHRHQHNERMDIKKRMMKLMSTMDVNQLSLLGRFQGMLKLLTDYHFIHEDTLTLKGRVARQIDIYVTEIIVQAVLDPLDPYEIAALLSAFVCDYKPRPPRGDKRQNWVLSPFNEKHKYTHNLEQAIDQTYDIIKRIVDKQSESQCYIISGSDDERIMSIVNFHLCDTVYKWALGFDFVEAAYDTDAPEGVIVKSILRLNMLLSNIKGVCKILGNSDLQEKVVTAIQLIKRDIVFCQSLYLSN